MSQLWEYIEKHPAETQRLVGINFDQLVGLITHAENLHNHQKKLEESYKTRIIKAGSGRPPKLAVAEQILLTKRVFTSSANISNVRGAIGSERISR
jgi:hypothetical protein